MPNDASALDVVELSFINKFILLPDSLSCLRVQNRQLNNLLITENSHEGASTYLGGMGALQQVVAKPCWFDW
jgi:hypothetical protein